MSEYTCTRFENACVIVRKDLSREYSSILFLDRDGIIIKDVGHISDKEHVELVHGIDDLIKRSTEAGMLKVVVTNQASVARRIISVDEYIEITNHIINMLSCSALDLIIASFYHPMFSKTKTNSSWRKPGSGMFKYVLDRYTVDINRCIMIGDRPSDIVAARRIGITTNYLVTTDRYADEVTLFAAIAKQTGNGINIIESLKDVVVPNG